HSNRSSPGGVMHLMSDDYDAVVVGARCAGAATAMLLARQNLSVLLVDRDRHGTDTLSTLALMRAGVLELYRWGLVDRVRAGGAPADHEHQLHLRRRDDHRADQAAQRRRRVVRAAAHAD